ncbi:MAG: L-seryl-tRNA(Sec) selenium transferase [Chloroflexota bacterium]
MDNQFRHLPSVDRVISDKRLKQFEGKYPHDLLLNLVRQRLEQERFLIASGKPGHSFDEIVDSIETQLQGLEKPGLRPVINATGVVLHTNLGRAPLSPETIAAMDTVAKGYSNLEFDLESGARGSRDTHIESLLCRLTGAEAALVVNNNASAVLLGLTILARRKEIIVSRGQAVEIGGGFRIPEVMRQSGAKLVEVGTTNCTYITDYEQAITPRTAAMLRVHSSNFQVVGFTHSVTLEELVALGRQHALPIFDDIGSGCLLDTTAFGLAAEPMVQQSIALGADLVFFSGDKLLGGPQAGIIVGKKQFIDKLKKHPLVRALRVDKVRLAGLVVTLGYYLRGEAVSKIPVWRMIATPVADIERRARFWAAAVGETARLLNGESMIGGGSLPGATLPTKLVAIGDKTRKKGSSLAQNLAHRLRTGPTPIVGRISGDTLLLDPRSVLPEDDGLVIQTLKSLTNSS